MEHLTEHVLFWNQKKIISLPKYLSLRYIKMKKHPLLELVTTKEQNISGCPKKDERQKLFKVSVQCPVSHCLYWWAMKPFFSQATMLMQDLETKKARHAVMKNKLILQGVGEEMSEDAGLQSLADSLANTLREKIMGAMSLIKSRQEMINKETAYAKQRSKLRKKNDAEKKTLKDAISHYNRIVGYCSSTSGHTSVTESDV